MIQYLQVLLLYPADRFRRSVREFPDYPVILSVQDCLEFLMIRAVLQLQMIPCLQVLQETQDYL